MQIRMYYIFEIGIKVYESYYWIKILVNESFRRRDSWNNWIEWVKDIALVNVNKMVLLGNTIHFECKQNALTITPNFPE